MGPTVETCLGPGGLVQKELDTTVGAPHLGPSASVAIAGVHRRIPDELGRSPERRSSGWFPMGGVLLETLYSDHDSGDEAVYLRGRSVDRQVLGVLPRRSPDYPVE